MRTVFDKCRELKPSDRGELEITDVNNAYIREGNMTFSILDGWWTDAGTFNRYSARQIWLQRTLFRKKKTKRKRSTTSDAARKPAIAGSCCRI